MKYLILIILLTSCASELFVTKKYIGKIVTIEGLKIETTQEYFYLIEPVTPPDSVYCYLKYIEKRIPGSYSTVYVLYFTWEGTDSLYLIRQNPFTGEIY